MAMHARGPSTSLKNIQARLAVRSSDVLGFLALGGTAALVLIALRIINGVVPCDTAPCVRREYWEQYVFLEPGALGVLFTVFFFLPRFNQAIAWLHNRWRGIYTIFAILACFGGLAAFILHFGNRQFGGFDFSILVDTAWRQFLGQTPYTDFVSTMPAGFNLGLKYAFDLMGPRWDSQLYAIAIFTCTSLLWNYWLLAKLVERKLAAFLMALTVECAAILPLDFWWYNNITAVTATIFFLSCLAFLEYPSLRGIQFSYAASLALLGLMKPNVAGALGVGAVCLTFLATPRKVRFLVITLAGAAGTVFILLLNGVSISGMLDSYRAAAIERGGLSTFGLRGYHAFGLLRITGCFAVLGLPLLLCVRPFVNALRRMDIHGIAYYLLLALAPLVSALAMLNNGEIKDVEWALPLALGAVLVFRPCRREEINAPSRSPVLLRRFYIAFLCALVASDVYMGAIRIRVLDIGLHMFFEFHDSNKPIDRPFFNDLRASGSFRTAVDQIGRALSANPRPVFMGPRLEFAYAAFGIPSPRRLPLYWQPGTSFARSQEPAMLEEWSERQFPTLIFLGSYICGSNDKNCDDFTYYSPQFVDMIHSRYWRDSRYSDITVYHLRAMKQVAKW